MEGGDSAVSRRQFLFRASAACVAGAAVSAEKVVAQQRRLPVYFDPVVRDHRPPDGHPERPERIGAVLSAVGSLEARGLVSLQSARAASEEELLLVHTPEYVSRVRREIAEG